MSVVYRARQGRPSRFVALKLLAPELSADAAFRERFIRESDQAASLDDPNVLPVYAAGEHDGVLYIAMRYVDGTDLKTVIREEGPLDPMRTERIVEQVAHALDTAHATGLIHRDVKPGNILLAPAAGSRAEHAYLADFGLSKRTGSDASLTGTGVFAGTMRYAAPEQFEGRALDARTDVYSLGCVVLECLTGRAPFESEQDATLMYAHLMEPPPSATAVRPELPPGVDAVVAKAMAKKPDDRFASCGELARSIREALGQPATESVDGPVVAAEPRRRRGPALVVGLVAGIVAIGVVVALATTLSSEDGGGGGTGAGGAATGTGSHAAVTLAADTLVALDPDTLEPTRSIPVGEYPTSVVVEGPVAWTSNEHESTVSWVRIEGEEKTDTIPVKIPGGAQALAGDGGDGVWAFGNSSRTIRHIDGGTLKVDRSLEIPAKPNALVFMDDGSAWETTGFYENNYAIEFDARTGKELARVETEQGPVNAAEGGSLWVVAYNGQELDRIDPTDAKVSAGIPIPAAPVTLAIDASDIWVGTTTASKVFHVDPVHGTVDGDVGTGRGTTFLAAQGGRVWVGNGDQSLDVIDAASMTVTGSTELGFLPLGGAVGDDGTLWIALAEG